MTTGKPFCKCLHETENNLPRTKFCRMPCGAQKMIMKERENTVKITEKEFEILESIKNESTDSEIFKNMFENGLVDSKTFLEFMTDEGLTEDAETLKILEELKAMESIDPPIVKTSDECSDFFPKKSL